MNCYAVCSDFTLYNIKRSSSSSSADTIAQGWKFNNWPESKIEERFQPDMVDLTLFLGSVGSAENYQGRIELSTQNANFLEN